MKRTAAALAVVSAMLSFTPARADGATGYVKQAVAHPAIPRMLYLQSEKLNGVTGFVMPLAPDAGERRFVLRVLTAGGLEEIADLDAWFYKSIEGTGQPCPRLATATPDGGESGTVCSGATHAVVVLFTGADVTFELSLHPHA